MNAAFGPCAGLAWLAAAAPAFAASPETGFAIPWLRLALATVFGVSATIVGVLAVSRAGVRTPVSRWLSAPGGRRLAVLEVRRLGMHADVCRLATGEREFVLVVGVGGVHVLEERGPEGMEVLPADLAAKGEPRGAAP